MSEFSPSESAPQKVETGLPSGAAVVPPPKKWTPILWTIVIIAGIGFAYDTYTLLVMPLVAQPALRDLEHLDPDTASGFNAIRNWGTWILLASAVCGGVFGLLGGYLTDRFGRQSVLLGSILLSGASAVASGFAVNGWMLLVCRCAAFIGVCVEFVAAVAWLAELFPNPKQREKVLGWTQACASLGGVMVAGVYWLINQSVQWLPAIYDSQARWRYALISALIVGLPLLLVRPFLPESPVWKQKRAAGTLRRPSILELFQPAFRRTSIVTAVLFFSCFGVAFGAIQLTPQLVPGLLPELQKPPGLGGRRSAYEASLNEKNMGDLKKVLDKANADSAADPQNKDLKAAADKTDKLYKLANGAFTDETKRKELKEAIDKLVETQEQARDTTQFYQEMGGLLGRVVLAVLATLIVSRRLLLWLFQVPALILVPLVFLFPAAGYFGEQSLQWFQVGIFIAGFFIVGQFSFWGNYLPRVYPVHLRGTGESFAANIGARMFGTSAQALTSFVMAPYVIAVLIRGLTPTAQTAYAAATTAFLVLALGVVVTYWLPQPKEEVAQE